MNTGANTTRTAEDLEGEVSIVVNGEPRKVSSRTTVAGLLEALAIHGGRVAIERNLQILPRAAWSETLVASGDRYEIVQFVGGG